MTSESVKSIELLQTFRRFAMGGVSEVVGVSFSIVEDLDYEMRIISECNN